MTDERSGNQHCEQCGESFQCDIAAGNSTCWCFDLPRRAEVPERGSCLCPRCLKTKLEEKDQD